MIRNKKIKGGALQFVLFVGSVIAVLLLSFVLVSYSHNLFQKKTDQTIAVIKAADMALQQSFGHHLRDGESKQVPIYNDFGIGTMVSKNYWGLLELRRVLAKKGQFTFEKLAFVGHSDIERAALYLKDNQRPLVLAGNTKIMGTAHLPERGVKMGNIHGYGYYAQQLIYGKEKRSGLELPKLTGEIQSQLTKLTSLGHQPKAERISLKKNMLYANSFKNPTQVIQGDDVVLDEIILTGNIIVWASHKIEVKASSRLQDVLLLAPNVEIDDWSKGNFQVLASKTIKVGRGAVLEYPSILAVKTYGRDSLFQKSIEPNIYMDSHAQVRGMVLYQDQSDPNRIKPHIKIDENAKVIGEVYSSQNVELKGSVFGSLTTSGFVALENGSIYQNHIYNGQINSEILDRQYAGLVYGNSIPNQVVKWLY